MRYTESEEQLDIPEGVTIEIKARIVTVTGPRGTLTKNFRHQSVSLERDPKKNGSLLLKKHHGNRKEVAAIRTVRTLINNMIIGVKYGFKYKMRYVYAHFPINVNLEKRKSEEGNDYYDVEIRNFLGEKRLRTVQMAEGVTVEQPKNEKDTLWLMGNSIDDVSQSAASIQGSCAVKNKDIRKFLDGIYVSEKTNEVAIEA